MTAAAPDLPEFDDRHLSLLWAVEPHAEAIAALHASMFPTPWDSRSIVGTLAHPGSIGLIAAQAGGTAVGGFALAQVAADEAEILTLGVAEPWRRHGVARRLVEGITRAARRSGAASMFLEVAADNTPAQALYQSIGFVEAGRRKGYYQAANAPPQDALVMRKTLVD